MALSTEDRNEIREIIMDNMKGLSATVGAQNSIIEAKIDGVNGRLDKINGSVQKHQDEIETIKTLRDIKYTQIDDYMNSRGTGCPHLPAIQALQTDKTVRFSLRQTIIMFVTIISLLSGTAFTILKINESLAEKRNKELIQPLQQQITTLETKLKKP